MRGITKKVKNQIAADPQSTQCARKGLFGHECGGRITMEHTLTFAGRQINAAWAIIPICAKGHEVDQYQDGGEAQNGDLNKEIHIWIALNRATDEELLAISKAIPYIRERARLNAKYGKYVPPPLLPINKINDSRII